MEQVFILNREMRRYEGLPGKVLADIVRDDCGLKGTTIACREGDCGACTLLAGEIKGDEIYYRSVASCISPGFNVSGKHVVTIEGLSEEWPLRSSSLPPNDRTHSVPLSPIQKAFIEQSATQCGYCTPGFIVSLSGFFLREHPLTFDEAMTALDGNICRCTGYKSIERAVSALLRIFCACLRDRKGPRLPALVDAGLIPRYFLGVYSTLKELADSSAGKMPNDQKAHSGSGSAVIVGGGTDLFVKHSGKLYDSRLIGNCNQDQETIRLEDAEKDAEIVVDSACRIEDFRLSPLLNQYIPGLSDFLKLFGSTQIRHQGTVAGNVVNASSIGDLSNLLLVLNTRLVLRKGDTVRTVPLSTFFTGYRSHILLPGERICSLRFPVPTPWDRIHFEKVSRRKILDIATVTSSARVRFNGEIITDMAVSAGGIAPHPLLLESLSRDLSGYPPAEERLKESVRAVLDEISPIDDVRGSAAYKRILLRNLIYGHFLSFFPDHFRPKRLFT